MPRESKVDRWLIRVHPAMASVPRELRVRAWRRLASEPTHGFLYMRIPKAANSTVSLTLARALFPEQADALAADTEGKAARKLFPIPSPRRYLGPSSLGRAFLTFGFYRNPYTRLLSAYLDKVQSAENQEAYQWVARDAGYADNREMTFERFVAYLERRRNRYANIHWAPQTAITPLPVEELDFVGYTECLREDLARLLEQLLDEPPAFELVVREHNRQGANQKLREHYTPELMERVHRLYEPDFQRLGYDPTPEVYLKAGG